MYCKELNFKVSTELAHKCKSYLLGVFWDRPFYATKTCTQIFPMCLLNFEMLFIHAFDAIGIKRLISISDLVEISGE